MSRLSVRLLGPPVIELDNLPIHFENQRVIALLAYLLVDETTASHPWESLASLFWPALDRTEARECLRLTLWEINYKLGEAWIATEGDRVSSPGHQDRWVDVHELQKLIEKGEAAGPADLFGRSLVLLETVALHRGSFMAGLSLHDCPEFSRWQSEQSERLQGQLARVLATLTELYSQLGEYDAAVACARRWLALKPLNEAAHRALIQCYDSAGQRIAALRQYDECVRILKKETGRIPEPATRTIYENILAHKSTLSPHPPLTTTPAHTLQGALLAFVPGQEAIPAVATPFIGREEELQTIIELLSRSECRLLSLIGPGGIGKTRLAVQAAQHIRNRQTGSGTLDAAHSSYPDGIFFISLADITSVDAMLKRIAAAVRCPYRDEVATPASIADNRTRLMYYLSSKKCLLVLDNLEQLAEAASLINDLFSAAPGIKFLVTSRRRLNLLQEWVVELNGMPTPAHGQTEDVQGYSSVKLFVQNAQRAIGGFSPSSQELTAIGRICQLLAGMPLAIELAAARARTFSCQEIASEIERSLDFLYSSMLGIPERHQSLRAVFEYSWRLLPERERSVVRKLSVFRGGFSREMAARVAGATLPLLTSLMDQSLVRRSTSGRYDLHETVKQYARKKLSTEPGEEVEALDYHSETFLDFLIETGELLKQTRQEEALRILDADSENISLAWERALEQRRVEHLLRALPALILYYEMSNQWVRGREVFTRSVEWFDAAIKHWLGWPPAKELPDSQEEDELALMALLLAAQKRFAQIANGSPEQIIRLSLNALELAHKLSNRKEKALSYILLCIHPQGIENPEVLSMCQTCINIFEQEQDAWGQAITWLIIGDIYNMALQENIASRQAYGKSLAIFLPLGNEWGKAICYNGLGMLAERDQNYPEAYRLWKECMAVFHKMNNVWRELDVRNNLARISEKTGRFEEAAQFYQESASVLRRLGLGGLAAWQLYHQARMELCQGQDELAHLHHQEALEIFHQLGDLVSAQKIALL